LELEQVGSTGVESMTLRDAKYLLLRQPLFFLVRRDGSSRIITETTGWRYTTHSIDSITARRAHRPHVLLVLFVEFAVFISFLIFSLIPIRPSFLFISLFPSLS
jgi:hypothetical protein